MLKSSRVSFSEATTAAHTPREVIGAAPIVLGRYRLRRQLGAGAFGTVWHANDERLQRHVAVKILPRERIVGGRFEREARAAARLQHPGIVTLYEAGTDDDGAYLVSELVRGSTLDELLSAGRLSDKDVLQIGIALCRALQHAHAQRVVHRDVKPSNILVPERAATQAEVAKLTDFGVARVVGGDSLTRTGDVIGTAAYMAPEQAQGLKTGPEADLYSLAVVLYEGLTGINPIATSVSRRDRMSAHAPPLRRQRRELPRELAQGIDLALRPRPSERGTLEELELCLLAALGGADERPGVVGGPRRLRVVRTEEAEQSELPPEEDFDNGTALAVQPPWPQRALAAAATAGVAAWLSGAPLHALPLPAAMAGLIAGLAFVALPKVGWLGLAVAATLTLATGQHAGAALAIFLAAAVPVALMPLTPIAWPVALAAPPLGLLGLAGAWPALAAKAGTTAWRRAVIAATGWVWLLIAEALTKHDLYLGGLPRAPLPGVWTASLSTAARDVLGPIATSGALLGALVWALAAVLLPYLVRGVSPVLDAARALLWATAVPIATAIALPGSLEHAGFNGEMLGALACLVIALSGLIAAQLHGRRIGGGGLPGLA
jgi:serine/threonine protein kinase